jgi:squalene synthase HpnC
LATCNQYSKIAYSQSCVALTEAAGNSSLLNIRCTAWLLVFIEIMPVNHYENFPVASVLLPKALRPAVAIIYAFARSADDLADEGDLPPHARLNALIAYEAALDRIARGEPAETPLFKNLEKVIADHALPLQPFCDLLSAFKQDVVTTRYETFAQLLDYCRRSADPVGRLMLQLYRQVNTENLADADAICSALQLINFLQDVAIDWEKRRIYLPLEDLQRFQVAESEIADHRITEQWRALMAFEVHRARSLMLSGAPLALRLPGRIGWELRMVVQGGLRILACIEANDYDVFRRRPMLKKRDWMHIAWRSLMMRKA